MSRLTASGARIAALDLRIRLERLAAAAFDHACKSAEPGKQSRAKRRLLCLLHDVPDAQLESRYRLIHLGAHVFDRTSDVLHGRLGMINLPPVVVDEWRSVVEQLEALARQEQSRPQPRDGHEVRES